MKLIKDKDWESPEKANKYIYSLRKELAVTETGCMLYYYKLAIPHNLKQLVIDAIHQTQPGQAGVLSLGSLVWLPCIHRSLTSKAQACDECTKQGENLKPISPKQGLGNLPKLSQPNDELQWILRANLIP